MSVTISVLRHPIRVTAGADVRQPRHAHDRVYALIEMLAWAGWEGQSSHHLAVALWGSADATANLRKTVQRARQALGDEGTIVNYRGRYALEPDLVTCDLWVLEDEAGTLLEHLRGDHVAAWARQVMRADPPAGASVARLKERLDVLMILAPSEVRPLLTAADQHLRDLLSAGR